MEKTIYKISKKMKWVAFLLAMVIALVGVCELRANANTMATLTRDSTTFTGSIKYVTVAGPLGYYTMTLSSSSEAKELYESVTLKSSTGVANSPISAMGTNTSAISASTKRFADNSYTINGYYYYYVITAKGNDYTFSTTY